MLRNFNEESSQLASLYAESNDCSEIVQCHMAIGSLWLSMELA